MPSKSQEAATFHVTRGNVLDDLGFSPAEALEIKVKADLYRDLLRYIESRALTQRELGALLGIHQPDVSSLLNGKISKFSVGKLIQFAAQLNLKAEVKLSTVGAQKASHSAASPAKLRRRKAVA